MALWCDVFNAAGTKIGTGPIQTLLNVNVARKLDREGTVSLQFPSTDKMAADHILKGARVRVYLTHGNENSGDYTTREIANGIVETITGSDASGSWLMTATGPDTLRELSNIDTMLGLEYNSDTNTANPGENWLAEEIVQDLISRVSGWSVTVDDEDPYYVRYDGMSILKALLKLAADRGKHVRLGTTANTLEYGAFGDSSGLTLIQPQSTAYGAHNNPALAYVESLQLTDTNKDVVNVIVPLGAGRGETRLDLSDLVGRSIADGYPYDVVEITRNGRTQYALVDSASIAASGRVERVKVFSQIQVQSNSAADIELAKQALYDAAAAWLQQNSVAQETYNVTLLDVRQTIRPGQLVRLKYKGMIQVTGTSTFLPYRDIDADYWVLEAQESVGNDGARATLKLSNVDRVMQDAAQIIVGRLEEVSLQNLVIESNTNSAPYYFEGQIAPGFAATKYLVVTNRTLRIRQVLLYLTSSPLRSTIRGAAAGPHNHVKWFADYQGDYTGLFEERVFKALDLTAGSGNPDPNNPAHYLYAKWNVNTTAPSASRTISREDDPAHEHEAKYGIYDDSQYPGGITLEVNGQNITAALGGSWGTTNSPVDLTLDITPYITSESTIQKRHTIKIGCASGQGTVEGWVSVYEDIQNLGG